MNKKLIITLISSLILGAVIYVNVFQKDKITPVPTTGETIVKEGGEDADNQFKREAWFEMMHQAAPGTNWKALEYQTQMDRHQKRAELRRTGQARDNEEILADGQLIGEWKERGSRNQAGSVFATEFDPDTEFIYLISAGGTLWRGTLQGEFWEPINQDLRFNVRLLKFIPTPNGRRMIAVIGDLPHYSDDDGYTWTAASGITVNGSSANSDKSVVLDNDENTIYVLSKPGYWDDYTLYMSSDKGETYQAIHQFNSSSNSRFAICKPHHSDDVYVMERMGANEINLYQVNQTTDELDLLINNQDFGFGADNARTNLIGIENDSLTKLLIYNSDNEIYTTVDFGATWEFQGQMPTRPWSVGIYMSPSNPDLLLYGDIECYVSGNGGEYWAKVNTWGAYYGDVEGSLHADMMYFNEFQKSDGTPFLLISNHGGLSVSYDQMDTKINIGLYGLNVSQYYDVRTDPIDPEYMYAGSQDQGFQRAFAFSPNSILNFDQVISGDYGHIVFSDQGKRLWTVYPGGWVTYYNIPQGGGVTASWEVDSDNESVWIPPLMESPDPLENAVYLAGGNMNGGSGSHIIKLTHEFGELIPEQLPFDFYAESVEGEVSAIKTSPLNPNHWFAATTNGRFFYSLDAGQTWEQTINSIPTGQYLYGSAILPSKLDENTAYFGGSGYSNPPVWKTINGGETFLPMDEGLPPTLVIEMAANEDESMIFAATEAGPYVFIVADELWYDMSGIAAPAQTYWSVEYLEESQTVRFGTYGRGIWDFQISTMVSSEEIVSLANTFKVFPNPSTDLVQIQVENPSSNAVSVQLSDLNGKVLRNEEFDVSGSIFTTEWSLKALPKGTYLITVQDGNDLRNQKIILQ